jgi:hypothetical protein
MSPLKKVRFTLPPVKEEDDGWTSGEEPPRMIKKKSIINDHIKQFKRMLISKKEIV